MNFRTGVRLLIRCPVAEATVIEPGDLLFLSGTEVAPAADFTWQTDLATTRAAFAAAFIGVAYSPSADGETEPVSVDVSPFSFYETDSAAAIATIGTPLGPAENAGSLSNTVLEAPGNTGESIARLVKTSDGTATCVGASFASAFFAGSANINAAVG